MQTPSGATGRVALFCYPSLRPGAGSIDFQFTQARTEQPPSPALPQTAALFLTACTIPDPNQGREALAISDALGTLVTFRRTTQAAS